jgi:hypothetical protein
MNRVTVKAIIEVQTISKFRIKIKINKTLIFQYYHIIE